MISLIIHGVTVAAVFCCYSLANVYMHLTYHLPRTILRKCEDDTFGLPEIDSLVTPSIPSHQVSPSRWRIHRTTLFRVKCAHVRAPSTGVRSPHGSESGRSTSSRQWGAKAYWFLFWWRRAARQYGAFAILLWPPF
ncbi:hypothetical protein B0H12DRAFT_1145350 [Mycena haematopus]|nr:hypothetical protein B0H12DRAFT_1145350 [Mycena haematopus]